MFVQWPAERMDLLDRGICKPTRWAEVYLDILRERMLILDLSILIDQEWHHPPPRVSRCVYRLVHCFYWWLAGRDCHYARTDFTRGPRYQFVPMAHIGTQSKIATVQTNHCVLPS